MKKKIGLTGYLRAIERSYARKIAQLSVYTFPMSKLEGFIRSSPK